MAPPGSRTGLSVHRPRQRARSDPGHQIAFVTGDGKALAAILSSGKPTAITYDTPKAEEVKKEDKVIEAFPLDLPADRVKVIPSSELFK